MLHVHPFKRNNLTCALCAMVLLSCLGCISGTKEQWAWQAKLNTAGSLVTPIGDSTKSIVYEDTFVAVLGAPDRRTPLKDLKTILSIHHDRTYSDDTLQRLLSLMTDRGVPSDAMENGILYIYEEQRHFKRDWHPYLPGFVAHLFLVHDGIVHHYDGVMPWTVETGARKRR